MSDTPLDRLRDDVLNTSTLDLPRMAMLKDIAALIARVEELEAAYNPQCPWPEDIWTMTTEQYVKATPDESLRTAISGFLMRQGWELALKAVKKAIEDIKDTK